MPRIFINFRGRDQAGFATLLDQRLSREFGTDAVFFSSRSIEPGRDFTVEILHKLRQCAVLLAVMGPDWLIHGPVVRTGDGDEPVDWVHREISEALRAGIRVIPVLVENATMPAEADLPKDIAELVRCQYLRLHHRNVDYDLDRIVAELLRVDPGLVRLEGPDANQEAPAGERLLFRLNGPVASPCRIGVHSGTIRRITSVDAWVNTENTDMVMSRITEFSVSGIIRYWGARRDPSGRVVDDVIARELAQAVGDRAPVAPGSVFLTGSGGLAETNNVRHIVHVAAVQGEPGAGFRQVRNLDVCVMCTLSEVDRRAAEGLPVSSILFPLLGTGVGGGDVRTTIRALVEAAIDYLATRPETALREVSFLGYTRAEFALLRDYLSQNRRLTPDHAGLPA